MSMVAGAGRVSTGRRSHGIRAQLRDLISKPVRRGPAQGDDDYDLDDDELVLVVGVLRPRMILMSG